MTKLAVCYERFSPRPKKKNRELQPKNDRERECESIEVQHDRTEAFCLAQGWPIVAHYDDPEKSGGSMKDREGLDAALAHVCKIRGVLVVYSLSRLVRDVGDGEAIRKRLERHRAGLASVTEIVSTTTAWGRAMFRLKMVFDQLEREQTAERTSDSMKRHQYAGGRRMGRPDRCPFGWRAVDGKGLEEEPAEQVAIRRIKELHAAGLSLRQICVRLDDEGIGRRGKNWKEAARLVGAILEREAEPRSTEGQP